MDTLLQVLLAPLRSAAIVPSLVLLSFGLFMYVMTRNYLRLRHEAPAIKWLEGEMILDRLDVEWVLMRTHTLLTNQRVLQLRLSWFLSKRKLKTVALEDVHSIVFRRYTNWFVLLLGVYYFGTFNPLAFVLVLLALQGKTYSIRFQTPFALMPWTRIVLSTFWRRQFADLVRFYQRAQATWKEQRALRPAGTLAAAVAGVPTPLPTPALHQPAAVLDDKAPESDFVWGRPLLIYIAFLMACGFVQRLSMPHLTFDDYFFTPIYLGLPVAVALRSPRDAAWLALLGMAALFTVKFPSGGLLGAFTADGGAPYFEQYIGASLTLLAIVAIASFGHTVHPVVGVPALLLWVVFVRFHMPPLASDFGLYAKVVLAMAAACLLAIADQKLAARRAGG